MRCHSSFHASLPPFLNSPLHLFFNASYTCLLPCLTSSLSFLLFSMSCCTSPDTNPKPTDHGTTPNKTSHPSLRASLSPSASENPLLKICCRTNNSSRACAAQVSHSESVMGFCGVRVGEGMGCLVYALEGRRENTPRDDARSSSSSSLGVVEVEVDLDRRIRAWAASSDRRARSPSSATMRAHLARYNRALSNSLATSLFPFRPADLLGTAGLDSHSPGTLTRERTAGGRWGTTGWASGWERIWDALRRERLVRFDKDVRSACFGFVVSILSRYGYPG